MVGIYFSGTGNTKYCTQQFVNALAPTAHCVSIEDENAAGEIEANDLIVLAYPIYYSNLPKILRDFLVTHSGKFAGKKVFLIATMGLFSGDGAGCAARLLARYGAEIVGGLHLKMPDCIGDEKALKKSPEENKQLVKAASAKIEAAAQAFQADKPTQEGLGFLYHMAGLFGQRLWFYSKTKHYSDKLNISADRCVGCGLCAENCPMQNIKIENGKACGGKQCTMCYRCISYCPQGAITLLGSTLHEQCHIEKYL